MRSNAGRLAGPESIPADRRTRKRRNEKAEEDDQVILVKGEIEDGSHI
jgi:hypothetical protein